MERRQRLNMKPGVQWKQKHKLSLLRCYCSVAIVCKQPTFLEYSEVSKAWTASFIQKKKNVAWILHAMKLFELDQSLWHCSIAFSSCRGPLCTINQSTPLILRQKKSGSGHEFSCLFQAKCKLVMDKGRQRRMNRMVQDESHNIHKPGPSGTLW